MADICTWTVGSNSNVGERGMDAESQRAAIWEVDVANGSHRLFATGLRNPNGMAWTTASGTPALWTVVNERDEIGSDLVPDYLTSVRDGAFYGWPYSYYGAHVDERVQPPSPERVAAAVVPDYALGPHTASLGLASSAGTSLPAPFANGMFIGQHGSWNRQPASGYQVVFVPFVAGLPSGAAPVEVLTGFLDADGRARGRPVGVAPRSQRGAAGGRRCRQCRLARQRPALRSLADAQVSAGPTRPPRSRWSRSTSCGSAWWRARSTSRASAT